MGRILGVDFGERRVGIALSDPTGTIAQPLTTIVRRHGKRPPVAPLARLAREHDVDAIALGLPLTPEGDDSDWTREVRGFGDKLRERTGLPVHLIDERMTSARAERAVRSLGLKKRERERKSRVDLAAAVLILQAFLDRSGPDEE
ncbi:MAG: Holliday junction resolvase RuvX [Gemmatimonadota bacterium]